MTRDEENEEKKSEKILSKIQKHSHTGFSQNFSGKTTKREFGRGEKVQRILWPQKCVHHLGNYFIMDAKVGRKFSREVVVSTAEQVVRKEGVREFG